MRQFKLVLFIALAFTIGCTPKIENDNSVGKVEAKTYKLLMASITEDMKRRFGGNMYESEKITPIETADGYKIGIPNSTTYTFKKDDSKYVKGDLNNDKLSDLIICATMTEGRGMETKKYFVYLQAEGDYKLFAESKADDMVAQNCRKDDLKMGIFSLDSINGGMLIGSTSYQGNHESNYLNFSYRCENEKYKINFAAKKIELAYQSDLLRMNDETGLYEKAVKK